MKKMIGAMLAGALAAGLLGGCAASGNTNTLTVWVYPVGSFAENGAVDGAAALAAAFEQANPGTTVEILHKSFGENDELAAAQQNGTAPDLVLDSAEHLLTAAAAGAVLADTASCGWGEANTADVDAVSDKLLPACRDATGVTRVYPFALDINCMAVNTTLLQAAGVGEVIGDDLTWTPEEFRTVLQAVAQNGSYLPGMLAGGGISGDQGSRMLLQNWGDVPFTDEAHTTYTFGGSDALAALREVVRLSEDGLLRYVREAGALDELTNFAGGNMAVTLCWSAANQAAFAQNIGFTAQAVAFPAEGAPQLYGTVYGFGIPQNNGAVSTAAVQFVQFACENADQARQTVLASGALPVRANLGDVYAGTAEEARMAQFAALVPYLGDLYGVTPAFGAQRIAWFTMLETAFTGKGNEPPEATPVPETPDAEDAPDAENDADTEASAEDAPVLLDNPEAALNNYQAAVRG